MSIKSTPARYGAVAIAIHWITALLIAGQLAGGFLAAHAEDAGAKASILRFHLAIGLVVLALTLFRIGWWAFADRGPGAARDWPRVEALAATVVRFVMYLVIVVLAASGIALVATSGAGPTLFGGDARLLPDFTAFPPFYAHATAAVVLLLLLAAHVGAALHHQFVRRDRLLGRMGIGRVEV